MKIFFTIIFLIIGINQSLTQDLRVQEPIKNFDKLWNALNDRYANFKLKLVNWNDIYKKYRPLINENTSNDSLFTVCNKMLLELHDGHVSLIQKGEDGVLVRESDNGSPSSLIEMFPLTKKKEPNIFQLIDITDKTLKDNEFSNLISLKKGLIAYSASTKYGYLRLLGMGGFSMRKYKRHIDDAIKMFENKEAVIIDIRFNGGGGDEFSFAIANRFADKKRIGHYKKERKKGTAEFKKLKTRYLKPRGNKQFTRPIVILTSDFTASAAEVFTMIMKELPYVIVIGDNTSGIFSDIYPFKLPNKWEVGLSHQQYFSADMKNYEGIGIEPDIKVLNKKEDIEKRIDPVVEKGIEILYELSR
jgi:hypothetical protein